MKKNEELSPHVRWIVAAMIALTLIILAYQQAHRAEYTSPELKPSTEAGIPPVPTAQGRIFASGQKQGVRRTEPVLLDQKSK